MSDEIDMANRMKKIGQYHAKLKYSCAFNSEIWEKFGEITMETICSLDVVQVGTLL